MGARIEHLSLGTTYDDEPASNTAAVVTLAAPTNHPAGRAWMYGGLSWSYDEDPTGGNLIITNGGTTAFSIDITAPGVGIIIYPVPMRADDQAAVVFTLAAGGVGVTGKLNVLGARVL